MAKAQHLDVNTISKVREEAKKAALEEAAKKVAKVGKRQGMSAEAIAQFAAAVGA